jgi:hypothetical protein
MSYYQYYPHEVFSGAGGCGCGSMGAIGIGGGISFTATKAWTGWKACSGGSQSLCLDAVDSIRAALGQLGYGQLSFGTPWTAPDQAALKAFGEAAGLPVPGGIPNEGILQAMEANLKQGTKPGPEPKTNVTKVGGRYMVSPGMGTAGIVAAGVLAMAVVGGLAVYSKRKDKKPVTVSA